MTEGIKDRKYTSASLRERYPMVEKWYVRISKQGRAKLTADVYLRRLAAFCEAEVMDPTAMIKTRKDQAEKRLEERCFDMLDGGAKPSHCHGTEKAVKSWFAFNKKTLDVKINIDGKNKAYREIAPSVQELEEILHGADRRARVIISLLAFSGLRPQVLGSYQGERGLVLGDIPDLSINGKQVQMKNEPATILVREELSKSRKEYLTFLSREGCQYLKDYLKERIENGDELTSTTPVISLSDRGKVLKNKNEFLSTKTITQAVRVAFRSSQYKGRPYVLRTYFSTNLLLAIQHRTMTSETRSFIMGHAGDMDRRYAEGRGNSNLSSHLIDTMREQYLASEELLSDIPNITTEQIEKEVRKQIILAHVMDALSLNEERAINVIEENHLMDMSFEERERFISSIQKPSFSYPSNQTDQDICYGCEGRRYQIDNSGIRQTCPICHGSGKVSLVL